MCHASDGCVYSNGCVFSDECVYSDGHVYSDGCVMPVQRMTCQWWISAVVRSGWQPSGWRSSLSAPCPSGVAVGSA